MYPGSKYAHNKPILLHGIYRGYLSRIVKIFTSKIDFIILTYIF